LKQTQVYYPASIGIPFYNTIKSLPLNATAMQDGEIFSTKATVLFPQQRHLSQQRFHQQKRFPHQRAFGHDPLFYTRDANSSKLKNTTIVLQQVSVCNIKTYEDYNDYGEHLSIWINFKMTTPIVFARPRKPLPNHKHCSIGSITKVGCQN
jgi:hypothetical protein